MRTEAVTAMCHSSSSVIASFFLSFFFLFITLSSAQLPAVGHCKLRATNAAYFPVPLTGEMKFTYDYNAARMNVTADISWGGFQGGKEYAIHVYEYGDLTDLKDALSTGKIYGRGDTPHGCPPGIRRDGDMGNWTASAGVIKQSENMGLIHLRGEMSSIIGLSVVVRGGPDNCTGEDGYSGSRLAQCVIGVANVENNYASCEDNVKEAVCVLETTSNSFCSGKICNGTIWFQQMTNGVKVTAQVFGLLSNAQYGIHVHQYGDMSNKDGSSAGAHYNPNGYTHELPPITPRHMGDLGNIQSYSPSTGAGWYQYTDSNIPYVNSIIGRSVVIHSSFDHGSGYGCDQAGSSGQRIMSCVIGKMNPTTIVPNLPSNVVLNTTNVRVNCTSGSNDIINIIKQYDSNTVALVIGWTLAVFFCLLSSLVIGCWCSRSKKARELAQRAKNRSTYQYIDDSDDDYDYSPPPRRQQASDRRWRQYNA